MWPISSVYSSYRASRSASRIFWIITCLAVWAPMRPTVSSESSSRPSCVAVNRTVFAVDLHDDVGFFAVVLLGGRDERSLDPLEDDFLVDVLVAMDRIDDSQNFLGIHGQPFRGVFARRDGKSSFSNCSCCSNCLSFACGLAADRRGDNISVSHCRSRASTHSPERNSLRQSNLKRLANP